MNTKKVKQFKHFGLYDTLYRDKRLGRRLLEKALGDWSNLGTRTRSPYGSSFFGQSLFHTQLIKIAYGIKKRSFLTHLALISKNKRGTRSTNLLNSLENKLDYFLVSSGYAKTLQRAKELIETGNIKVNGELVKSSNVILNSKDRVTLVDTNPVASGETMCNVVSGFSLPTTWSLYLELLEDIMLLNSVTECYKKTPIFFSTFPLNTISSYNTDCTYSNSTTLSKKSVLSSVDLVLSADPTLQLNNPVGTKNHMSIWLDTTKPSLKYKDVLVDFQSATSMLLEDVSVGMRRFIAGSCLSTGSFTGLERTVLLSLLSSHLSSQRALWDDFADQVTSDLTVPVIISDVSPTVLAEDQTYVTTEDLNALSLSTDASEKNMSAEELVDSEESNAGLADEYTYPQEDELALGDELDDIKENADYYSQLEIDLVENRNPYVSSYKKTRSLYCNYVQAPLFSGVEEDSDKETPDLRCENCTCELEEFTKTLEIFSATKTSVDKSYSKEELICLGDYYAQLLNLEFSDVLLETFNNSICMSESTLLRDKKEGVQFSVFARSPELTGDNFYLDPELWELRSKEQGSFSESKTTAAEHVIKTLR